MPRTALTPQVITTAGLVATLGAANAAGHSIVNSGNSFVVVANGAGAPINVTIQTPAVVLGEPVAERVVSVTNGTTAWIGPFPPATFNQTDGTVYVDFSDVGTITCAAIRLGAAT